MWFSRVYVSQKIEKYAWEIDVSPKLGKGSPRIVLRNGKEDGQIRSFLKYRELIKKLIRKSKVD